MTEHTHHDEDSACAVAHSPMPASVAPSAAGERTLVAVFASPVAGHIIRDGESFRFDVPS